MNLKDRKPVQLTDNDGRQPVFASNRRGKVQGETNIFIADLVR